MDSEKVPSILAVLVLYKMPASSSPAYLSLVESLRSVPSASAAVDLMVCDNSPDFQLAPNDLPGKYVRDPTNPGLAAHYNAGLQWAHERGIPWLLLLDQDTTITHAYMEELLNLIAAPQADVPIVALVPKLVENGLVQSPRRPPGLRREIPLAPGMHGLLAERVHVYNSGAALKTSALKQIGGFSLSFPLDFLDHVTFHVLQSRGGKVYLLNAALPHELSGNRTDRHTDAAFWNRLRRIRDAEYSFYHSYGSTRDRLLCSWRFFLRAGRAMLNADWTRCLHYLRFSLHP